MSPSAPDFMTNKDMGMPYRCPAMRGFYKNMFGIPALYDYDVEVRDGKIYSNDKSEEFFKAAIHIRNAEMRGLSLNLSQVVLLPDADSLGLTQYPPFLETTLAHANYFPGSFDIGNFPRVLDLALRFLSDCTWKIRKGDILHYIKFDTEEKIKFIPFAMSHKMASLMGEIPARKTSSNLVKTDGKFMPSGIQPEEGEVTEHSFDNVWRKVRPLSWYYGLFNKSKIKKQMLIEAKRNT